LDIHRSNGTLNIYGRAAIAKEILEAEKGSKLYFNQARGESFDPTRIADTWFVKFMHILSRGIIRENVSQIFQQVSFVSFNYDRCVKHFLTHALQRSHAIRADQAAQITSMLRIIHPHYGVIGDLDRVPFGATRAKYIELAGGIKTYTEQVGGRELSDQLTEEISRADCIVFLGFAYHRQNMHILSRITQWGRSPYSAPPSECRTPTLK
jgi:hypothetical protein